VPSPAPRLLLSSGVNVADVESSTRYLGAGGVDVHCRSRVVGDGDAPFFAGSDRGPYEMRGSGRLYLGVNDDYLQDNSGTFRVVVSY